MTAPVLVTCGTRVSWLPGCTDLRFYEGDDIFLDLVCVDSTSDPVDMSDYRPRAQIRNSPTDNRVLCEFRARVLPDQTPDGGPNLTNIIRLHLLAAANVNMPAIAVWDVQIKDSGGHITTLLQGNVFIDQEVTRP